jgi:PRD1 phage membrane DNA delivery
MERVSAGLIAIVTGAIGLAIVAVLVSQRAQTPSVLSAAGDALSSVIGAAVSPVTGGSGSVFGSSGINAAGSFHFP